MKSAVGPRRALVVKAANVMGTVETVRIPIGKMSIGSPKFI